MRKIIISTNKREQIIDITGDIQRIIKEQGIEDGICFLYIPHTTAGLLINENFDPTVIEDIKNHLSKLIPKDDKNYRHTEGNSDSHIKSSIIGQDKFLFIKGGKLFLGRWQGVFFCEFDGPRQREVYLEIFKKI